MPNNNEGNPAPESLEAKVLAELEKEGNEIEGKKQLELKKEETPIIPKEEVKETPKEEKPEEKPHRQPTMVEAWKLKVAEDQKASLEKDLTDLKAKVEDLFKQKAPITKEQKTEIQDDIKAIADEAGVDADFLTKFADTILKKAKPSEDIQKTLKEFQEEKELAKQENLFSKEFEADVLPIVEEYNLSGQALSQLKKSIKDFAFSETYAKVPLKEIFKLKEDTFELKAPKKSSEGKGIKHRSENVDLDNLDEEKFKNLTDEQIEKFVTQKSSGGWK